MDPVGLHPFAAERSLREVEALLEGHQFQSVDEINARLKELTSGGRISEMAGAWKRDDPKWRAQELAYEALETDDFVEALRLVKEATELDPDCTDAQRLMVALLPMELDNRIQLMREVVDGAERNLGDRLFEANAGHFWSTVSTRPYMRAKQHLGELLAEAGRNEEAMAVFERLLELNPTDNQGIRYPLLGLCLATNQPARATALISRYPDEETILASHGREFWSAGFPDSWPRLRRPWYGHERSTVLWSAISPACVKYRVNRRRTSVRARSPKPRFP